MMAHAFNPSTWVLGQPGLQSKFQDSQSYTEKPCLNPAIPQKTNQKKNKQKINFTLAVHSIYILFTPDDFYRSLWK